MKKDLWKFLIISIMFVILLLFAVSYADEALVIGGTRAQDKNAVDENEVKNTVKLSFAGDVIFEGKINNIIKNKGLSFLFEEVKPYFEASDISMVNLETPVSKRGTKEKDKQFTFRADPDSLKQLKKASGINTVSLANNHILDFGRDALSDTLTFLEAEGIRKAGAGEDLEKASMPVYYEINGHKIALIASSRVIPFVSWHAGKSTSGVASTYNTKIIKGVIADAEKKADIVIVYAHWGQEKSTVPIKIQEDLARTYIDSGADLVVGAHPHVLEGMEIYNNRLIAYSLGNFVFTDLKKDSMILSITIENKKITKAAIIPCEIRGFKPFIIKDKEKLNTYFDNFRKLSRNVAIDFDGNIKLPREQED